MTFNQNKRIPSDSVARRINRRKCRRIGSLRGLGDVYWKTDLDRARQILARRYPRLQPDLREAVACEVIAMMHAEDRTDVSNALVSRALGAWLRHQALPYDAMCRDMASQVLGCSRLPDSMCQSIRTHLMAVAAQMERYLQGQYSSA